MQTEQLPFPPLNYSQGARSPQHRVSVPESVMIHLLSGDTLLGKLHAFHRNDQTLELEEPSAGEKRSVPLEKIRYVIFTFGSHHNPGEPGIHQRHFHLDFVDADVLEGQCLSTVRDGMGIHLLKVDGRGQINRLFIPAAQVARFEEQPLAGGRDTVVPIERRQASVRASRAADDLRARLSEHPISDEELHQALAEQLGIPFVKLADHTITPDTLAMVPGELARKYGLIPLSLEHGRLLLAMDDPTDIEAVNTIQFLTNYNVELVTATQTDIEEALREHYDDEAIQDDIQAAEDDGAQPATRRDDRELGELERLGREKPIIRLVNRMIVQAIRRKASDIHIRPREEGVDLYYRIDGTLVRINRFSRRLLPAVVSRIKIFGTMDIAERRLPQDGRARVVDGKAIVDLRISVIPTVEGESVVIRLLNLNTGLLSVSELGFGARDADAFTNLLHKSYGIVLVTGPTGSGKSTTLYAALQEIRSQNVNIITVEDPVEYHIDGIAQIQVNTAPGYTFARALRHILRHDPDVVMIGEIRDEETGKIAIESALTGHLVLSTLHTNDSAGALSRLMEMGIEPYLINATVLGVLAQRLVRRNCPHCVKEEEPDDLIRRTLGVKPEEKFYRGSGCEKCHNTGFSGRIAAYELLTVTPAMHRFIHAGVSVQDVHEQAIKDGMIPLTENALTLARKGTTSLSEVYRVRLD